MHKQPGGVQEHEQYLVSCYTYVWEGRSTRVSGACGAVDDICVHNRTGQEECDVYKDNAGAVSNFVAPTLGPKEMCPVVLRNSKVWGVATLLCPGVRHQDRNLYLSPC